MERKEIIENINKIDRKIVNRICLHMDKEFPFGWQISKCEISGDEFCDRIYLIVEDDFCDEFFVSFYSYKKTPYSNAKLHCKIQDGKMKRKLPKYNPHYVMSIPVKG